MQKSSHIAKQASTPNSELVAGAADKPAEQSARTDAMHAALKEAVEILGGNRATAQALGVPTTTVSSWINRDKRLPAERVLALETACGGRVSRHSLRPDVFGPAPVAALERISAPGEFKGGAV